MKQVMQNIMLAAHIEKTISEFIQNNEYVESKPIAPAVIGTIMERQEGAADRIDVLRAALIPFFAETVASHKGLDSELNGFDQAMDLVRKTAAQLTESVANCMENDDDFKTVVSRIYDENYTDEALGKAKEASDPLRAMFYDAVREVAKESA